MATGLTAPSASADPGAVLPAAPVGPLPAPAGPAQSGPAESAANRPDKGPHAVEADGEIPALRSETSRTFRMKDGRLQTRVASAPVNHRDGSGGWRKNDNALADDGSGGGRNRANAYQLSLPSELGRRPVTVAVGADSVGFALDGASGRLSRKGNVGLFDDALPGVDLEYRALDGGVKETLILESASAPTSYTFTTALSRGLTLAETDDGGLVARAADGSQRLVFTAPNVQDGSGSPAGYSTAATKLELTDSGAVALTLDPAWLRAPERVFPVRLDPSYSRTPAQQTYLNSGLPTSNLSGGGTLHVGTETSGARNNVLAKFDTSPIPRDAEIYNAGLSVDIFTADPGAIGTTIVAKPVTRAWSTIGASWNSYDGTNPWTTAGGDVGTTAASTVYRDGDVSLGFDARSLARNWVTGTVANHGVHLSSTSTSAGTSLTLYQDSFSPTLTVDWVNRTGDKPYYTYSSKGLTDRTELKVNVATGNLLVANTDLDITAPGLDHTVGRFYNSRGLDGASGALPPGWTQTPGNDEQMGFSSNGLLQFGPTGSALAWRQKSDNTFERAPGEAADLTHNFTTGASTLTERQTGLVKTYNNLAQLTAVKDRNGNQVSYAYDAASGWVTALTDTAGGRTTMTYGCRLASMTDPAGRTYKYGYDSTCNYLTSYTDPAGKVTTYGYNSAGLLSQIVTPAGRKTLMTYDSAGRALTVTQVTDTVNNTGPVTRYAYSAIGGGNGKTVVTDPNGNATSYFYDATSRVTKTTDALSRSRSATYNADNSVTEAVDAMGTGTTAGNSSRYAFDSDFRSSGSTAPTGASSTLRYAEATGPVTSRAAHWQPSGSKDANDSDTAFTYDGPGNLSKASTSAPTGAVSVSYTRNGPAGTAATCGGKPGQVCTATDGNGNVTRYTYNATGDLAGTDNPAPLGDTSSTYDSIGRPASSTDGKGQVTRYTYDALDRVTQVMLSGATACTATETGNGTCVATGYDADGNQTSQVDQTGTTSYGYDLLGRQTSKTLPGQAAQTLAYDPTGNLTSITDPGGTTGYRYDAANQLTSLAEPGGSCTSSPTVRCTTFGYNNNGVRTSTTYPTSTATVMSFTPDNSSRVKQIRAVTGTAVHSDFSYGYATSTGTDSVLTTSRTDAVAGRTTSHGHDTLNRLTSATERDGAGTQTAAWSYGYDNAGNRTSATINGTNNTFGYNAANQLVTRNGASGFSYDLNGNETAAAGSTTRTNGSWNNKEQLVSLTAGGTAVPFGYTGLGNSERTSRAGTTFTTSPTGLATETTSSATTSYVRDPSGTLIALRNGAGSFYYLFDGLGSVVGLVNSSGTKVNSYSYDPYGISRTKAEQVANPFEYTGGYLDDATGLYKLGIRYYDPTLGRFTQLDPTGQDLHYAYAGNSPVTYTDVDGDVPLLAPLAAIAIRQSTPRVASFVASRLGTTSGGARNALGRALGRAINNPRNAFYFADRVGSVNRGIIRIGESVVRNTGASRPAIRVRKDHYYLD